MADFYVTADNGTSLSAIEPVAKAIEAEGFTVETGETGPNAEHLRNEGIVKPPTKLVFICNGGQAGQTYGSFALGFSEGMCFTIFAFDNFNTHFSTTTEDATRNKPLVSEHDSGSFATDEIAQDIQGHTSCSYQQKYPQVFAFIADETSAENLGKRIAQGDYTCGEGDGAPAGSSIGSGGGAQIKDKTFEHCIRRICAATDSIFVVDNNVAVLFPYTDWMAFTLRQKIDTIKKNEIDPNVFSMEYNNDGFYNKVSIAWGGVTLPERFQEKTEGEKTTKELFKHNNFTIDDITKNIVKSGFTFNPLKNNQTENKKNNQNQNTTTKTITKKDKTTQELSTDETGATILSEQYDSLVKKYGVLEKRVQSNAPDLETAQYIANALLIQYVRDFNNSCRCRTLTSKKYNGGTFHAVQNPFTDDIELFYLNGYSMRMQKKESIYHDLDFRYGPESAEELADYQTFGGGAASGGATSNSSSGPTGSEESIWQDAAKCKWAQDQPDCSTNDPATAKKHYDDYTAKGEEVHFDCFGMSAYLYGRFNNEAKIPCQVVGDNSHKVVMLDRGNGFVSTKEEYRKYNLDYLFKWRENQNTTVLLPAPNSGPTSGGNTNSNSNGNSGGSGSG